MAILKTCVVAATSLLFQAHALAGPLCAYTNGHEQNGYDSQPQQFATQQMQAVSQALCSTYICPRFGFYSNNGVQNASASTDNYGSNIRYNSAFMTQIVNRFGSLATGGILAHELGHIIDFASRRGQIPQADREATADLYAGCAFALAGHSSQDLNAMAGALHALGSSPGYPSASQRVQLLYQGFDSCD